MDLLADLKNIVEDYLKTLRIVHSANDSLQDLILLALNHELKTVNPRPRRVYRSTEFTAKLKQLNVDQQRAAAAISTKFEKGEDVAGHLSKDSARPEKSDKLLSAWKIHHLHISNHKDKPTDTFYSRTGPIMFAHIVEAAIYFIDIHPHGSRHPETWTRQELLRIIDLNWPHILDPYRLKGIIGLSFYASDMDLKDLHRVNTNVIIQVGNSFIAPPGGGLAMDGTPFNNVFRMNRTIHLVQKLDRVVATKSAELRAEIAANSGLAERDLDFQLVSLGQQWGVIEKKTQTLVARSS
jgi:hypothetical protein